MTEETFSSSEVKAMIFNVVEHLSGVTDTLALPVALDAVTIQAMYEIRVRLSAAASPSGAAE